MVGLIPLFAVETLEPEHGGSACPASSAGCSGSSRTGRSLAITSRAPIDGQRHAPFSLAGEPPPPETACCVICSTKTNFFRPTVSEPLAAITATIPYIMPVNGMEHRVDYEPAESSTGLFGGNSNWRGPIWFPVNYLLIESLQKVSFLSRRQLQGRVSHRFRQAGEPCGRHRRPNFPAPHADISTRPKQGRRPVFGGTEKFQNDPHWRDLIPFP